MFNLFHRRYLISLTYLWVVIIGIIVWRNVPLEMAPDLNLSSITVSYSWGSTSPEVMEQAANRLRDVQKILVCV